MGFYDIKPRFRQALTPLANRLAWVHPDAITFAGVGASVLALLSIIFGTTYQVLLLFVPVWLFVRIACNALDGLVAQRTGKARPFGEVLNEGADRIADVTLLFGLGCTPWASFALAGWTTVVVLMASYIGLLGKAVGVGREYGGILGKSDRMFWMGVVSLVAWKTGLQPIEWAGFHFHSAFDVMLAAFLPLALLTACQRLVRIHRRLQTGGNTGSGEV